MTFEDRLRSDLHSLDTIPVPAPSIDLTELALLKARKRTLLSHLVLSGQAALASVAKVVQAVRHRHRLQRE